MFSPFAKRDNCLLVKNIHRQIDSPFLETIELQRLIVELCFLQTTFLFLFVNIDQVLPFGSNFLLGFWIDKNESLCFLSHPVISDVF